MSRYFMDLLRRYEQAVRIHQNEVLEGWNAGDKAKALERVRRTKKDIVTYVAKKQEIIDRE